MRVYAETDFLKEIAYRQPNYRSCLRLVAAAERGAAELYVPAVCLLEATVALVTGWQRRRAVGRTVQSELDQALRSEHPETQALPAHAILFKTGLDAHSRREATRFKRLRLRLLSAGCIVQFDGDAASLAADLELTLAEAADRETGYGPGDAAIISSVLIHLSERPAADAVFVTGDRRFRRHPQIVATANAAGLSLRPRFGDVARQALGA